MSDNKQIVINQSLHRNLKTHCAENDQKIKEYAEAALEYAMENQLTIEQLKEKQYRDSYASTAQGGPMVRYGSKKTPEPEIEEIQEEAPITQEVKKSTEDSW